MCNMEGSRKSLSESSGQELTSKPLIFLSYKWNDSKAGVWKTAEYLESLGRFTVWLDKQEMYANKLERMEEGIKKADVVVIFFNDDYQESVDCRTEAEAAYRHRKKKLFVKMKPNDLPFQNWFAPIIGNNIYIDFYQFTNPELEIANHIDKLLSEGTANDDRIEKSRDIPSISSYIERTRDEEVIQEAFKNICEKPDTGGLLVYGEGGVGKTMLIVKSVASNDAVLRKCCISVVIWINVCQLSFERVSDVEDNLDKEQLFYNNLASLINVKFDRTDALGRLQNYFKATKPNKILLVIDDLFDETIFQGAFRLGDNVRCIAISRRRDVIGTSCDRFLSQIIEVQGLSNETIVQMFRQYKDIRLDQEKIYRLAELCSGLPLLASVIRAKLRRFTTKRQAEAYASKLVSNFTQLISEKWTEDGKKHGTVSQLLLCGFESESEEFRRRYYAFLIFDEAVNVGLEDLAILWQSSYDDATEFTSDFFNMSLIRTNCGDNEFDFDVFTVHAFLYAAALEFATKRENNIEAKNLADLRYALLSNIKNEENENVFHQAVKKGRWILLYAIVKAMAISPKLLFELCSQRSNGKHQTPLHYLLGTNDPKSDEFLKNSLELVCRISNMALEADHANALTLLAIEDSEGHTVISYLISTVKAGTKWFHNSLHLATIKNYVSLVKLLLVKGADVNAKDEDGRTVLMTAACCGLIRTLDILLSWQGGDSGNVADLNLTDNENLTALMLAVGFTRIDSVKLFLKHKVDVNFKTDALPKSLNALMMAIALNQVEMAEVLLSNGAAINSCEFQLLSQRFKYNPMPKMEQLLSKWNSFSPAASSYETTAILIRMLNVKGVDSNDPDMLLVNEALHEGRIEGLEKKLVAGQISGDKMSVAIFLASFYGNLPLLALLIKFGGDIDCFKEHHTPLIVASDNGHAKIVELLLENGTDVNARSYFGSTALLMASHCGHEDVVKVLLEHNVDSGCKNSNNDTPLSIACISGHENVVRMLLEKGGANVNSVDKDFRTPLILAAMSGHEGIVKLLLDNNADVDSRDRQDLTALMWASSNGHSSIAELLQSKTASKTTDRQKIAK